MSEKKVNVYPGPYHWYLGKFYARKHEEAAHIAKRFLKKSNVVLDVGCGDGRMEELLAPSVKKIVAIDNQERPLEFARLLVHHPNVEFKRSAKGFPVPDASCDVVLCFDVIEHIAPNQLKGFVGEVQRVLKKNGTFFVTTPNRKELRGRIFGHKVDPKHYKEYTIPELEQFLEQNEFSVTAKTGVFVPVPIPFAEHFASIYPFYWLFLLMIKLGKIFPSLAETMVVVGRKK